MQNKNLGIYYDKSILKGFGGVENYAVFLNEKLSSLLNVVFICDKNNGYYNYNQEGQEVSCNYKFDIIINLSGIDPNKTYKFCQYFKNTPIITILHMDPGDIIYRVSSKLGIRSIIFIKLLSFIFEKSSKIRRSSKLFKSNYKNSFLTLVIAKEYINKYCSLNGIKDDEMDSIDYILNPLINQKNDEDLISNFDDKQIKIVWAGRNNKQKRPDLAYEFCELIESQTSYTFTVFIENKGYFDGFKNENYRNCFIEKPFKDSIKLKNYNVLLLTSDFEGYPLIIIEALAMGLWILCSDSFGAAKSLLNSPEIGIVYPYNYSMSQVLGIIKKNEFIINNPNNINRRIEYSHSKFDQNGHIKRLLNFI